MPQPPPPKRGAGGDGMLPTELLEQLNEEIALVTFLEEHLGITRSAESPYGAFAMEHGVEIFRTTARWARSVIERLQGDEVS